MIIGKPYLKIQYTDIEYMIDNDYDPEDILDLYTLLVII